MKRCSFLLLLFCLICLPTGAADYRTEEYRQMQQRLCSGWNTWYNNSMVSHVLLPEDFAISLCFATDDSRNLLKDVMKKSDISRSPERVYPGMRSDDGAYTSLRLEYRGMDLLIESAVDGEDELILVTPKEPYGHYLMVEAGLLYGHDGLVGREGMTLKAVIGGRELTVNATQEPLAYEYLGSTAPRMTFDLMNPVGIYTGKERPLEEITSKVSEARKVQEARAAQYGDLAESFLPMQQILAWNTIYDAPHDRVITPVSRNWNVNWGGYVLFDWDTYFASYMCSLFNKELAFANAIEITKAITPDGFYHWGALLTFMEFLERGMVK